jgi:hypothetical protein
MLDDQIAVGERVVHGHLRVVHALLPVAGGDPCQGRSVGWAPLTWGTPATTRPSGTTGGDREPLPPKLCRPLRSVAATDISRWLLPLFLIAVAVAVSIVGSGSVSGRGRGSGPSRAMQRERFASGTDTDTDTGNDIALTQSQRGGIYSEP